MSVKNVFGSRLVIAALSVIALIPRAITKTVYVDSRNGRDTNLGTKEKPFRTIGRAAETLKTETEAGPTTIKVETGVYSLTETVVLERTDPYTEKGRLIVEASILPEDPQWTPASMPIILSTEDPRQAEKLNALTETYSVNVKISHVTIRGLKFLGNPLLRNWHCCIQRVGEGLTDLLVTQCLFVGDPETLNIYCPVIGIGDKLVVDHCIFYRCHASVVFWDGPKSIPGRGCAMRYCIVDGGYISGVWTCQTAKDFEFHHNIVTRTEYFWMRKRGEPIQYRLHDCMVTDNQCFSGYGVESGATGPTEPEITYKEQNVITDGEVVLEKDKASRNYLHVVPGSLGSDLGAGLFKDRHNRVSKKQE